MEERFKTRFQKARVNQTATESMRTLATEHMAKSSAVILARPWVQRSRLVRFFCCFCVVLQPTTITYNLIVSWFLHPEGNGCHYCRQVLCFGRTPSSSPPDGQRTARADGRFPRANATGRYRVTSCAMSQRGAHMYVNYRQYTPERRNREATQSTRSTCRTKAAGKRLLTERRPL